MSMHLSVTSWSFPACNLEEVAGISKVLGINAIDVGYFYGSALDKQALLQDPVTVATKLKSLGVKLPSLYHLFGDSLADRNLANPAALAANVADFRQVVKFCLAAGIPTVFLLPGVVNPGQSRADALKASVASLNELVPLGKQAGLTVTIEPHVHSYLESPTLTLQLLELVPNLRLTLDYAHFICMGYQQEEIDLLAAHVAHVHVRQARPGKLQVKSGKGTINQGAMLGTLRSAGYVGALAIEYVYQDFMSTLYDDVLTETIKTRDELLAWLDK